MSIQYAEAENPTLEVGARCFSGGTEESAALSGMTLALCDTRESYSGAEARRYPYPIFVGLKPHAPSDHRG